MTPLEIEDRQRRWRRRRYAARMRLAVEILKDIAIAFMGAAWLDPYLHHHALALSNYGLILAALVFLALAVMLAGGGEDDPH